MLEDGVDRLLLRLADEGAGVDEDHFRVLRLADQAVTLVEQAAEHHLAVYPVLRATERQQEKRGLVWKRCRIHSEGGERGPV